MAVDERQGTDSMMPPAICAVIGLFAALRSPWASLVVEALRVLKALDLRDQFDAVMGVDQVNNAKPDPEIYLLAASKLDVPPEECLVIEDSPPEVRAVPAAGMNVVAVAKDLTELGLHTDSGLEHQWVVHDPHVLLEVVQRRIPEHNRAVHHEKEG